MGNGVGPTPPVDPFREFVQQQIAPSLPTPGDTYVFKASKRKAVVIDILPNAGTVTVLFQDGLQATVPITDLWQAAERK